jgi:excisionase family DNA binding protein
MNITTQTISENNPLFTRREAAEHLRVSRDTLDRIRKSGDLKTIQISKRRVCFLKSDLDALLQNRRT